MCKGALLWEQGVSILAFSVCCSPARGKAARFLHFLLLFCDMDKITHNPFVF